MKSYDYQAAWAKVMKFQSEELPASALKVVKEIYQNAEKEKNNAQLAKSLIHEMIFVDEKEENSQVSNIYRIQNEIKKQDFPVKPVLQSMLAEMYWRYYQNNRWKFQDRSKTQNFKNDDIETWNLDKIIDETINNYQLSIEHETKLQNYKIELYNEIIYKGNDLGRKYRPTLYDFLANRALDMYVSDEPAVTKPAYNFTISSEDYLLSDEKFSELKIETKDTLSYKYYAIKIYQKLTAFHLKDEKPDALIDIGFKRLKFVNQHLVLSNKTSLFLNALEILEKKYISNPLSTIISYEIANVWLQKGNSFDALKSDEHKWDLKTAYNIAEAAKNRFPDSDGADMCSNFQQQILYKNISVVTESMTVPNEPFRALVKYKNFTGLYWRIIKTDRTEIKAVRKKWERNYEVDQEEKFLEYFTAKTPAKIGNLVLPDDKDYQNHSAEIKLDGVMEGDYMVLLSNTADFTTSKNSLSYGFITSTNLSFISRSQPDGSIDYYVLQRKSGEPIKGVQLRLLTNRYNSSTSDYETKIGETFITDDKGFAKVTFQSKPDKNSFFVDFIYNNDKMSTLDVDAYRYSYEGIFNQYVQSKPTRYNHTFLFLDRAIYRPGQTVYFKGLIISTDGKESKILEKFSSQIIFYDVNYQIVGTQKVVTNEFGTFNGTFTAPSSGLTGSMQLTMGDGSGNISLLVEEYKRPKFEVKTIPVKGSYRLNDLIKIEGSAVAYSGAKIDGAGVKYRIVRSAQYPYWWWSRWGYYPNSPEVEILSGQTLSDAEGKFNFEFKALADLSVLKESDPTFNYRVFIDVTDINGETHSNEAFVNVGYKSLLVNTNIENIDKAEEKLKNFEIISTNLSGVFEPAKGNIIISKLKNPEKAYRERVWDKPDKFVLTKEEFKKYFPADQFDEENNFLKWPVEKQKLAFDFNTDKEKIFNLKGIKDWETGKYKLEIFSKDKYGEDVKEVRYFEIFDSKSSALAIPTSKFILPLQTNVEPGGRAKIIFGSSLSGVKVLYEIEEDGKIISSKWLHINNNQQLLEFPILEEHRGGLAVHFVFVKDSRVYAQTLNINVPFTNKELQISFESFRDKLLPGQQEQWKLKIAGKKGDKVMGEMLASMYDASLDEFAINAWYAGIFQNSYNRLSWAVRFGFEIENFRVYSRNWFYNDYRSFHAPDYDYLNWFGYSFYNYPGGIKGGLLRSGAPMKKMDKNAEKEEFKSSLSMDDAAPLNEVVAVVYGSKERKEATSQLSALNNKQASKEDFSAVKIRKNFNETAFFFPDLKTDEDGNVTINFTIPEALTKWKMMGFAHTKDLMTAMVTKELVTQKDLMVVPNQPRFFRENDKMAFAVKINSMTGKDLSGTAQLEFFDALTMKPIDDLIKNKIKQQSFVLKGGQSTNLEWNIEIPEGIQAINYKVVAKAENFSDGEEMTLPVVTNRMLVTETLPLPVRSKQTKEFRFEKLLNNKSSTLRNHRFTLEFTSNPAWYAIQALPYLMEYPYECVEQTFSRFYANSIASHIANSNPKIKNVFDTWKNIQPDALLSNLEKNQELKSAILEETPWVLNAKDESQRKRNVALLFDLNRMANEEKKAIDKIIKAQTSSGGFTWFPGYPEDRYMTQHIIAGMGHLDVMGVKVVREDDKIWSMVQKAIQYMDNEIDDEYDKLKALAKKGLIKLDDNHLGYYSIHYLYSRSYFKDIQIRKENQEAVNYFLGQQKKYWTGNNLYMQGMMALSLHRFDDKVTPQNIIKSFNEKALHSEEMGMYWKYESGYWWYLAPIETQSLMVEVYDEVAKDKIAVEDLKTWLLKQKQTTDWKTTKATAEACYALLRRGTDLLANDKLAEITLGDVKVDPKKSEESKIEAGTGYFKPPGQPMK